MAGKTAQFTLQTDIADTEFYVSSSDDQCKDSFAKSLVGKDIPTFFTESESATGSLSPDGNCDMGGRIRIHIWEDKDFENEVVTIHLTEPDGGGVWTYDFEDASSSYSFSATQGSDNTFTFSVHVPS